MLFVVDVVFDVFLCGYVKDKVYTDAPHSIQVLKENIRAVIDEIEPQMCENVMDSFIKRAWSYKYLFFYLKK